MLTLEQVITEQRDLEALCAPRPLVTSELFPENDNYGMASILKSYAGVPESEPLRALVPHGVYLEDTRVAVGEARAPVPAVLCYPDYRRAAWEAQTDKLVVLCASPVAYAAAMLGDSLARPGVGSLFFPVHSTAHISTVSDDAAAAARLLAESGLPQPVRVCMYWRDVELGRHEPYRAAGLEIVSAGHIADRDFVYRLLHLMSWHERLITNALGSHVFYASHLGRPVTLWPQDHAREGDPADVARDAPSLTPTRALEVDAMGSLLTGDDPAGQAQFAVLAASHLGMAHFHSPEGMRELLQRLRHLDRGGSLFTPGTPRLRQVVPYAMRRRTKAAYWSTRHTIFGALGRARRWLKGASRG